MHRLGTHLTIGRDRLIQKTYVAVLLSYLFRLRFIWGHLLI